MSSQWYTYIVQCSDGTLYTGISTDIAKRVQEHNAGKTGAKYTRSRRPVVLVYSEESGSRSTASRREHQIKKMSAARKKALIKSED